jgi:hypothetical protein
VRAVNEDEGGSHGHDDLEVAADMVDRKSPRYGLAARL